MVAKRVLEQQKSQRKFDLFHILFRRLSVGMHEYFSRPRRKVQKPQGSVECTGILSSDSFIEADATTHAEVSVLRSFFIDSWSRAGAVEGGGASTVDLKVVRFVH